MEFLSLYVDEESPNLHKILLLCYVFLMLISCGGNIFGFTPLKEVFIDEGIYHDTCEEEDVGPCESQLTQLDSMFTMAASLFSAYLLPAGLCLRILGPRFSCLTGLALVALGSLGFAIAPPSHFPALYVLIGTGNPLLYMASFNFVKIYPPASNLLLSICIGCFGFSSIIFYLFNQLHFLHGQSFREIFRCFAILPLVLAAIGFFILPPYPYQVQMQRKHALKIRLSEKQQQEELMPNETTPLRNHTTSMQSDETTSTLESQTAPPDPLPTDKEGKTPLRERSFRQQLKSPQFWAQTIFFSWGMLHQNFYLGTIGDQLFLLAGDDQTLRILAKTLLSSFSWGYPLGCLAAILPVGALVRTQTVTTSLFWYCVTNLIFASLTLIPWARGQWLAATLYVIVRVGFFTIMSTYSATLFGFANLSSMFGSAGCIAGLVSLGGRFLSNRALHIDHSFVPVNRFLLIGGILNFGLPLLLYLRKWERKEG